MIFDSHAHYTDDAFDADREELLGLLPAQGVGGVVTPGVTGEDTRAAVLLAARHAHVWAAAGIHPHSAATAGPDSLAVVESFLRDAQAHRVVAVGECGLDYHYDFSPRQTQMECFDAHIELALRYGLPLIVHDREAHADTLERLKAHPGCRGVFHCWSGSTEMALTVVRMGFFVSFAGSLTFPNAHRLREAARALPEDRLLLETDAPYMTPVPLRGRRNDSRLIVHTLKTLAEIRGVPPAALEERTWLNARALFGI